VGNATPALEAVAMHMQDVRQASKAAISQDFDRGPPQPQKQVLRDPDGLPRVALRRGKTPTS